MARRTMNTTPERNEYRRSFVAWGGGLRFRLKGTFGLEGRRIFMDSLQVDRRPPGDRVVRFLRGIPTFRIVGPEHVDLHTELSLQEAEVFPEHRELVHGRKPGELIRFGVSQVLRDFLGERRDLFRRSRIPGSARARSMSTFIGIGPFLARSRAIRWTRTFQAGAVYSASRFGAIPVTFRISRTSASVDWRRTSAVSARGSTSPAIASGYRAFTTKPSPPRRCQISSPT